MSLECLSKFIRLFDPLTDKMHRVLCGLFARLVRDIGLLCLLRNVLSGDAMILKPEMAPGSVLVQMRF